MTTAPPRLRRRAFSLLLLLGFGTLLLAPALAQTTVPEATLAPAATPVSADALRLPGVSLAEGITQVTGVAISPLLGVCGVGTWQYFMASPEQRHLLPWFCHPVAWGIGFGILGLGFTKDLFGSAMPAILKKPFDLIELFEDKLSAIVAGTAFLPFLTSQLSQHFAAKAPATAEFSSALSGSGLAFITPELAGSSIFLLAVFLPFSLIAFFAVWLTSHYKTVTLLHLLPRHRHDLEAVAAILGVGAIHDHYVGRGMKAITRWAAETFPTKALPGPGDSTVVP